MKRTLLPPDASFYPGKSLVDIGSADI
jgi:hypothetical protein